MSTLDVSVVIPTRDRPEWLSRALTTALAQQSVDFEVIVVHDGPDNGGLDPVRTLADARVKSFALPSQAGMAGARNAGITAAAGTWIAFLDDDDLWSPLKLRGQLDAAGEIAGFVYSSAIGIDLDARVIASAAAPDPEHLHQVLKRWNVVPAGSSNVITRRDALDSIGGFDSKFNHLADWDAWIRLTATASAAAHAPVSVAHVLHPAATSSRPIAEFEQEFELLQAKHWGRGAQGGLDEAAFLRWLAGRQLFAGRSREAASLLTRAAWKDRSPRTMLQAFRIRSGLHGLRPRKVSPEEWVPKTRVSDGRDDVGS